MTTPVIIDAIVVVILVGFCLFGARRGLFQAFAGLVTMIVALVGAGIIAASFSGPVTGLVAPLIEEHITQQVDEALGLAPGEMPEADVQEDEALEGFGIEDQLALLGVDQDVRDSIAQQAQETVRDTGVSVASAVVESIAGTMIYGALCLIAFLVLMILLHILVKAMDLVLQLPGLHGLNALGGALIGLAEGALALFLAVWVLRRLGVSFESDPFVQAHILRIFTTNTPLSVLSFLQ
mgnify:FL=1